MTLREGFHWARREIKLLRSKPVLLLSLGLIVSIRLWIAFSGYGGLDRNASCTLQDTNQSAFESWVYLNAMKFTYPIGQARRVAMVTITEGVEPLDVINNTCANRTFLASLVHELELLNASVIAIDQSYSEGSCNTPSINTTFRAALQTSSKPIVVGQRVHKRPDSLEGGDCLVEDEKFNFRIREAGAPADLPDKVRTGLLRLNENLRKIPLFWWVFANDSSTEDKQFAASKEEGFAYVAAAAADDEVVHNDKVQAFIAHNEHPYTSFAGSFPTWSAMDVLCYGHSRIASRHPEWGSCDKVPHTPFRLDGKVIVVGDHIDTDRKSLGGNKRYGMDLHAEYIEALLDRHYVGTVDWRVDDTLALIFLCSIVACDFISVRRLKGKEVLSPTWHATGLSILMVIYAGCAFTVLEVWHLMMPNVLLAISSTVLSLVAVILYAILSRLSRKFSLQHTR